MVEEACENLEGTSREEILEEATKSLYDGVSISDVRTSLVMTARTLVEKEPNYTYVTARILLDNIRTEALTYLGIKTQATHTEMINLYPQTLEVFIKKGLENGMLDPKLQNFDLGRLGSALKPERDRLFTYLGLQTLYDSCLLYTSPSPRDS